jgi:hypothetical protein
MIAKNFKDHTDEQIGDWLILRLEQCGGGVSKWLARHKCGNERILRIDQIKKGSKQLCTCEGETSYKTFVAIYGEDQAKIMMAEKAANKPKPVSTHGELTEQLRMQNDSEKIVTAAFQIRRKPKKKMTAEELGKVQAEIYAKTRQCNRGNG